MIVAYVQAAGISPFWKSSGLNFHTIVCFASRPSFWVMLLAKLLFWEIYRSREYSVAEGRSGDGVSKFKLFNWWDLAESGMNCALVFLREETKASSNTFSPRTTADARGWRVRAIGPVGFLDGSVRTAESKLPSIAIQGGIVLILRPSWSRPITDLFVHLRCKVNIPNESAIRVHGHLTLVMSPLKYWCTVPLFEELKHWTIFIG